MTSKTKVIQKSKNVINIKINTEPKKRRRRTTKPNQKVKQQQPIIYPSFQPTPRIIYQQNSSGNAEQIATLQQSLNSLNSLFAGGTAKGLAQKNRFQPTPSLNKKADAIEKEKLFVNEEIKQHQPLFEAKLPSVEATPIINVSKKRRKLIIEEDPTENEPPTNEDEPPTLEEEAPTETEAIPIVLTEREQETENLYPQYLELRRIARRLGIKNDQKISKKDFNSIRVINNAIDKIKKKIQSKREQLEAQENFGDLSKPK